ncbi:4-hydroxy-tetrahydrodipicolinate synthase [Nocardioidaceae bacterium]|nr:4-hydroxy-tetrahydrodipicolinate synthase [Nocardioidaceae bacterium]
MTSRALPDAPFGRVLTAMVTPFTPEGAVDLDGVAAVATALLAAGNDGLVVSGTTGESPTTTPDEDGEILAAVRAAVGPDVPLVAGVGTNDTRTSLGLARQARDRGADCVLLVSPYYNKPGQRGLLGHFRQVVDAAEVPVMLYDVPGRTGSLISLDSYAEMAAWEQVVAVKDAAGDVSRAALLAGMGYAVYSGDDANTLGYLAYGGCGVVSVAAHAAGREIARMIDALDRGDLRQAVALHQRLVPAFEAVMGVPNYGATTAKAAMQLLGVIDNRRVRSPLAELDETEVAALRDGLAASGLLPA